MERADEKTVGDRDKTIDHPYGERHNIHVAEFKNGAF
jgi:hypothetical protein